LLCPFLSFAQSTQPRFENDTLYTSGGYKIYKGQVLHLANGTSDAGYFRFIKFHPNLSRNDTYILQNCNILVNKLRNYKNSGSDNYNIRISGTVTYKDGTKAETDIIMDYEMAIENIAGQPGELTVPEEFKNKRTKTVAVETKKQTVTEEAKKQDAPADIKKLLVADEIKKLFDLYKAGALTKEEYEAQKKKLLERQ
ncbi:MAG: SHOCT domain-containing protein, partial [Ferruginibacter sp.]